MHCNVDVRQLELRACHPQSVATVYADNQQLVARTNNELTIISSKIGSLSNSFSLLLGQNSLLCQPASYLQERVSEGCGQYFLWDTIRCPTFPKLYQYYCKIYVIQCMVQRKLILHAPFKESGDTMHSIASDMGVPYYTYTGPFEGFIESRATTASLQNLRRLVGRLVDQVYIRVGAGTKVHGV